MNTTNYWGSRCSSNLQLGIGQKTRGDSVDIAPNANAWSTIGNGDGEGNGGGSAAGQTQSSLWLAAQSQTSLKRQREQEIADKVRLTIISSPLKKPFASRRLEMHKLAWLPSRPNEQS